MNDYICLVLGETGEGKSSFINSKTKSSEKNKNQNYCKTSPDSKECTRKFKISKTYYENNCYAFIDTPGLVSEEMKKMWVKLKMVYRIIQRLDVF
jgi:putative ribosome biogenesis GTPase RsgA